MTYRLLHNIGTENHPNYNTREEILACNDVLTFDGVYKNVWENRDVLKGKKVIFFFMGGFLGSDNSFDLPNVPKLEQYCTHQEILEMAQEINESGGEATVGYHTWNHPDLTTLTKEEIFKEVKKPTPFHSLKYFAYPYGRYNELVKQCVKEAGYEKSFSVFQTDGDDFSIPRPYLNK